MKNKPKKKKASFNESNTLDEKMALTGNAVIFRVDDTRFGGEVTDVYQMN